MARMKKADVIEKLRAIDVAFNANAHYDILYDLLKRHSDKASPTIPDGPRMVHIDNKSGGIDIPKALYDRATKIVGFTDEQIATYPDAVSLEMACQRIKPQASAIAAVRPKLTVPSRLKGEPATIDFTSEISEVRAAHIQRPSYDDMQMNDFLRRERIDLRSVQMVTLVRDYRVVGGVMTTEMCIDYVK